MPVPPPPPIVDAEPDSAIIKAEVWIDGDPLTSGRAANVVPHIVQAVPAAASIATPVQPMVSDAAAAASVSYDPAAHDTYAQPDSRDAPVVEATPADATPAEDHKADETPPAPTEPAPSDIAAHADENNSHPDEPNSGHDTPTDQNSDHS